MLARIYLRIVPLLLLVIDEETAKELAYWLVRRRGSGEAAD